MHVMRARQTTGCAMQRIETQNAERQYVVDSGMPSTSINDLIQAKYLSKYPQCPAGGIYLWINDANQANPFRNLGCSFHYFPSQMPASALTPLGSTFTEISDNFIKLLDSFYNKNERYARTWGDYTFTDIGMNPSDWKNAINGVIYKPGGNRFSIEPDIGYVFYVNDTKGVQKTLTPELNWNLVYSLKDKTWYYHSTASGNEIDITTLRVEKK